MTARILVAGLLVAGSLPAAAQGISPTPQTVRAAQCDQQRKTAEEAGWDLKAVWLMCDRGVVAPIAIRMAKPVYTTVAKNARIQGSVEVAAIVETDGSVREARVQKSLDAQLGLDEEALKAARASTFEPGKLNGAPVRTMVTIVMQFTLR